MTKVVDAPRWEQVALQLEAAVDGPTDAQKSASAAVGLSLPEGVPATVAAVLLRVHLGGPLLETPGRKSEIPATLTVLESKLKVHHPAALTTGTSAEVSAWFAARYMQLTARGLREVQPGIGDVVAIGTPEGEQRVISSIGDDGRVYMKGRPPSRSWPNHLHVLARAGEDGHRECVARVESRLLNGATYGDFSSVKLAALDEYRLPNYMPTAEAVRALEDLLESGESREEPFQRLLTEHPALLAASVVGASGTYVIPKQRLGAEHVPDFLVLGLNSIGPQWLLVEIEAPRHNIVNVDGTLSGPTRHAVKQVEDWGEWLTGNVSYAQNALKLYGITNRAPGLVIIGRSGPSTERQASRSRSQEGGQIAIHSWDWVLRAAHNLAGNAIDFSEFARRNVGVSANVSTTVHDQVEEVSDDLF